MIRALTLLTLIAFSALADENSVVRGSYLKKRAYQTYAAMTLYVDPTGSDSNPCTASGTAACLTLGAALQRVPIHIRHLVTVNVAAGTYTEVFRVQGFTIEGANGAASTAALAITGTQVNVTPTTGSATGTLTAYSATVPAHAIATDSGATWTVNDFRGRLLQITGGTGSGQTLPIVSNTATALTLASAFSTPPNATSTYAIVSPGPVFTGSQGRIGGLTGGGTTTISDISFQPASGGALSTAYLTSPLTITRSRIVGQTVGFTAGFGAASPTVNITNSYIAANTASGMVLGPFSVYSFTGDFVYCTGTCSTAGVRTTPRATFVSSFTGTISGVWNEALFTVLGPLTIQSSGLWFDCTSATNIAIYYPPMQDTTATSTGAGWAQNAGPYINNCGTGYSLNNVSSTYIDNGTVFNTVTDAIVLTKGARIHMESGVTFTTVTNQLTIDGEVFTDADLTTYTRLSGPQGSYASRP